MASQFACSPATNYDADRVRYFPVTAAQTFIVGALVLLTGGAVSECGADPAAILGIALAPASMGLDSRGSIFGDPKKTNMIPVFVLTGEDVIFMASSTTPVYATHVGQVYGIVKSTNWLVDISDTSNTRIVVVDVSLSPQQEGYYVRFKRSALSYAEF